MLRGRAALLDRAIAEAAARDAAWTETYPHNAPDATDGGHFRGPRGMDEARNIEPVVQGENDTVMRRHVG